MLLITGEVRDVTTREVTPANSAPFSVTTVHVLEQRSVTRVDLARDFRGQPPTIGEHVAYEVSPRAYVSNGKAYYSLTAWEDQTESVKITAKV